MLSIFKDQQTFMLLCHFKWSPMRYQGLREVWHGRNSNRRADWCQQIADTPQHQHNIVLCCTEISETVLKKANSSMVCVLAAPLPTHQFLRKLGLCLSVQVSCEEDGVGHNMTWAWGVLYWPRLCFSSNCTTETLLAKHVLYSRVQYLEEV